ncbi:copper-binding protein [Variovorax sp. GB1R11]|uniref:copper-binding protein n=1 Tax=Variovorax sp. GB1R11 TaxID=3443741 RepID=UPI003F454118
MSNIRIALLAFVVALSFAGAASAQSSKSMADMPTMSEKAPAAGGLDGAASSDLSEGEIRKVDKDNKKLTIKHGPLKNLDMPGMTMVFGVKDDAMLDKVDSGAKVRFQAEKIDGKIVVTKIEAAR